MHADDTLGLAQARLPAIAYLTKYDGLLCGDCALNTDDLVGDGQRWLNGLTAIPVSEVLRHWPADPETCCCEECERPLGVDHAS